MIRPKAAAAARLAAVVLVAMGCCAQHHAADILEAVAPPEPREVTVVYAASFGSGGSCQRNADEGCDLYRARLDLAGPTIRSSERLTDTAGEAEWFPSLDVSGELVLFERRAGRHGEVALLDLATGTRETLFQGRYPDFDHQGQRFAYSTEGRSLRLVSYQRGADGFRTGTVERLGRGRDPELFPDGEQLLFHVQPDDETTRTALLELSTGERRDFSEPDRCAHAAVSPGGTVGVCAVYGTVYGRRFAEDDWGPLEALATPPPAAELDARFAGCDKLSYGYAAFCGDDDHLVVTLACARGGEQRFANLVLVDLTTGEVTDLHAQLASFHGSVEAHSATAACGVL